MLCRAILFDLDGVLVDSRAVVERTWRRWAALRGVDLPDLVTRAHGRRSVDTVRAVTPHLDAEEEVRWLAEAELTDVEGLVALPGALAALETLGERDYAVVTSGGRALAQLRLRTVGLPEPRVLIAAEDVRSGKPSPDGYWRGAEQLGVAPARCVVIEDAPAGIDAGRAAGAPVIAVSTTFPKAALVHADVVIDSLASVQITRRGGELALSLAEHVA